MKKATQKEIKALKLTEDMRKKVLEMAAFYFPEFSFELEIEPQYDGSDGHVCIKDLSLSLIGEYIHWFEFCFTLLSHKMIYIKSDKLSVCKQNHTDLLMETMKTFYNEEEHIHPIDYLYNIYKEQKK